MRKLGQSQLRKSESFLDASQFSIYLPQDNAVKLYVVSEKIPLAPI